MKRVITLSDDDNTLDIDGVILKAFDIPVSGGCFGCHFEFDTSITTEICGLVNCTSGWRKDHRNIIWKDSV